jgi:hypothetical protein
MGNPTRPRSLARSESRGSKTDADLAPRGIELTMNDVIFTLAPISLVALLAGHVVFRSLIGLAAER